MELKTTEQIEKFIQEIANDFIPLITEIENSIETTQNHYGDYLQLINQISDNPQIQKLLATALIVAGANIAGISAAMSIQGIAFNYSLDRKLA